MNFIHMIPNKVLNLMHVVESYGYDIYLVGGCVRDLLMDRVPHDWDMCTNADPLDMLAMFEKENLSVNPKGIAFGTVTVWFDSEEFEITTYREDLSYLDGRHPDSVNFVKNIETDLSRRDFTINAMAYNPIKDELIDCFNGKTDLDNGIIRCVGNANERMKEDGLRILRAIRFAVKFGFFIEADTVKAMYSNLFKLDSVSKERITQELEKILTCGMEIRHIFLRFADIIVKILPELEPCVGFKQNNKYHKHEVYEHCLAVVDNCKTDNFIIKLAALLHDIGKPVAYVEDTEGYGHFYGHPETSFEIVTELTKTRLRLTSNQKERLLLLVRYHDMDYSDSKRSVRRLLSKFGLDFINDWLILKQADIDDHVIPEGKEPKWIDLTTIKNTIDEILQEESALTIKDLAVNGLDIMELLNIKPGKEVGLILQKLLDLVIEEEVENTKENLLKIAQTLIF